MPKSKRDKVVALTKTDKKGREHKAALIEEVRQYAEQYSFLWVLDVENERNNLLKEVRNLWKGSKLLMGRNAVMRKALGNAPEDECRLGAHKVAKLLEGTRGLLFTDEDAETVTDWFETHSQKAIARSGTVVSQSLVLPAGPVIIDEEAGQVAPHTLDAEFRKYKMPTKLVRGVPTLTDPYTVCKEGDTLTADQAQLLKLLNKYYATFRLVPRLGIQLADGKVIGGTEADDNSMES